MNPVEVDGSQGEGGGQILRTAVAFSAIQNRPVRVTKVRAGRDVPGLKRQHVAALEVLAKAFGGRLRGAHEGSSEVEFVPGDTAVDSLSADMGTAASITLVLQAVIPAVAVSGRSLRLHLTGGTDVPWSPTFDYLVQVVRPAFREIGVAFEAAAERRGYYPRGGGRVTATIGPSDSVRPIEMVAHGDLPSATVLSRCGDLPRHVAERQLSAASKLLDGSGIKVRSGGVSEERSDSPGSSILVSSAGQGAFLGADAIGARGKPAEEIGREAGVRFLSEARSPACLDSHLADMVIPLLSLAPSPSRVRIREATSHLKSGLEIARQFTSCSWTISPQEGSVVVEVTPGTGSRIV